MSEGSSNDHLAKVGRGKAKARRPRKPEAGVRSKASDVGRALRSVYDTTLREDVPNDFLDLLGKLS